MGLVAAAIYLTISFVSLILALFVLSYLSKRNIFVISKVSKVIVTPVRIAVSSNKTHQQNITITLPEKR